ncbi:MAG: bifunctional phosphoglucose/phosphomannose isomerase [archaeon]
MPASTPLIDMQNMKGLLQSMPQHVEQAAKLGKNVSFSNATIRSVVICGMGGSAIGGQLLADYFQHKLAPSMYQSLHFFNKQPSSYTLKSITCNRDYALPATVDENTLVIISSYSGNTEESISCYREALKKTKNIMIITSGGRLKEASLRDNVPCIELPQGLPPRIALPYLFLPLLNVLDINRLIPDQSKDVQSVLKATRTNYEQTAQDLAQKLQGKIPLVYASTQYYVAAYRMKTQFNENTKIPAYANAFPEMNHNELCTLTSPFTEKFAVILLTADDDHKRVQKRMTIFRDLIGKKAKQQGITSMPVIEIRLHGDTYLGKACSAIFLGDWISYHLAINYSTNPTPVDIVEEFKKLMGSFL